MRKLPRALLVGMAAAELAACSGDPTQATAPTPQPKAAGPCEGGTQSAYESKARGEDGSIVLQRDPEKYPTGYLGQEIQVTTVITHTITLRPPKHPSEWWEGREETETATSYHDTQTGKRETIADITVFPADRMYCVAPGGRVYERESLNPLTYYTGHKERG